MKTKFIAVAALIPLFLLAADKIQPLNAKLGLWEITTSQKMGGAPPIPADALAAMTPEQRARVEAMFKQRAGQTPATRTNQTCITPDKLTKAPFSDETNKSCQRTIISSTSKLTEIHEECTDANGTKRIMDGKFELLSGDTSMKGNMAVKAMVNGKTMNIDIDMTGKWLGADCSKTK